MPSKDVGSLANTIRLGWPTANGLYIRAFCAELLGRYSHLSLFADQAAREARGRSSYLFSAFSSEVSEALDVLLSKAGNIFSVPRRLPTDIDISNLFDFLIEQSLRFQNNHEALRSFGNSWPDSEVFEFLSRLFAENGLSRRFHELHPTIVYSDEFNFLNYDLRQDLLLPRRASAFAVWALPKAEGNNPLLWPVLVHEVAHSLFPRDELQRQVHEVLHASQNSDDLATLKRWAVEFNADYFAFRLLGPSYLFCLMYFSMFFVKGRLREPFGTSSSSRSQARDLSRAPQRTIISSRTNTTLSHPPPEYRLFFLREELEAFFRSNNLGDNLLLYEVYKCFKNMYDCRIGLDEPNDDDMMAEPNRIRVINSPDKDSGEPSKPLKIAWETMKKVQHRLFPDIPGIYFCSSELTTAGYLADQLFTGNVAGSMRQDAFLTQLKAYLAIERSSKGSRIDKNTQPTVDKKLMLQGLNERPARMCEVLNAGWMAKIASFHTAQLEPTWQSEEKFTAQKNLSELVELTMKRSRELSRLLQKSIQIAIILSSVSQSTQHVCVPNPATGAAQDAQ